MFSCSFILTLILLFVNFTSSKNLSDLLARDRLINHLFINYDPQARPAPKGQVIELQVNIEFQHFDYSGKDGAFNFLGMLNVLWHDPKLAWNPNSYNNITHLTIDQRIVWIPDVEIYNNVADKFFHMHRNGILLLDNTGQILWANNIASTIFCTPSMKYWPHDQHVCNLQLGSWIYDGLQVDMNAAQPNMSLNFAGTSMQNTEYKVTNFSAVHILTKYECCTEPYVTMSYIIEFERRAAFAIVFHIFACCIVLFNLLALSLPTARSEKLWLNSFSLLLINAHLLYFATKVSSFALETPLIVVFHCACLVLVTGSFLLATFSMFAVRSHYGRGKLPNFISNFLRRPLFYCIRSRHDAARIEDSQDNSKFIDVKLYDDDKNLMHLVSHVKEWIMLARFLEQVVLVIYIIIYLILATICFI